MRPSVCQACESRRPREPGGIRVRGRLLAGGTFLPKDREKTHLGAHPSQGSGQQGGRFFPRPKVTLGGGSPGPGNCFPPPTPPRNFTLWLVEGLCLYLTRAPWPAGLTRRCSARGHHHLRQMARMP